MLLPMVVALFLLIFLLLITFRDALLLSKQIRGLSDTINGKTLALVSYPRLTLIRNTFSRIEALHHRFLYLSNNEEPSRSLSNLPITHVGDSSPIEALITQLSSYLSVTEKRFLFKTAAIGIWHDGIEKPIFLLKGRQIRPVLIALEENLTPFLLTANKHIVSGKISTHDHSVFRTYGIVDTLQFTIPLNLPDREVRAILWMGYPEQTPPSVIETRWAESLAEAIGIHASTRYIMHQVGRSTNSKLSQNDQSFSNDHAQFLTHMSHDLRAPLNNVKSILHLLALKSNDEDSCELLDIALNNSERLHELVSDIVDFSRFQAGCLEPRFQTVDLNQLLTEVTDGFKVAIRLKRLDINLHIPTTECLFSVDPSHFRRIISNLISNAIKYTKVGKISLSLSEESSGNIIISVKDSGIGMTQSQIEQAFTPFSRFHESEEGAGLGLPLSQILAEKNGGSITCSSTLGEGSLFTLTFEKAKSVLTIPVGKVLLIDNDQEFTNTLERILLQKGWNISKAHSVESALFILSNDNFHAIVSDFNISGLKDNAAERLLNHIEKLNPMPLVIFATGLHQLPEISSSFKPIFLQKPIDPNELDSILRQK